MAPAIRAGRRTRPGPLEDSNVFGDRVERHGVRLGELRHRRDFPPHDALQNGPPNRMGESGHRVVERRAMSFTPFG